MEARVQPHRPQTRAEAEGQEAERVGWPRAPAPVVRRASDGLAAQVTALGGARARALNSPNHTASCVTAGVTTNMSQCFVSTAGGARQALVVGERVPQEDEDEDDAGRRQGRAGDVEQSRRLGVFHCSVQVIEKLLVPDLRPEGGGEASGQREGKG